jgi:hypothetical protein
MYSTLLDAITNKKLDKAIEEIKKDTPDPMNTMLEKESHTEAIRKAQARESMTIVDVPPTNPGRFLFI